MPKIFSLLLITGIIVLSYASPAQAANCNFAYDPSPNQNMTTIKITVSSNDLPDGNYKMQLFPPKIPLSTQNPQDFKIIGGKGTKEIGLRNIGWVAGEYEIQVWSEVNPEKCSTKLTVSETPAQPSCTTKILNSEVNVGTNVDLEIKNIAPGEYDIFADERQSTYTLSKPVEVIPLGGFTSGRHLVKVTRRCGLLGANCAFGNAGQIQCPNTEFVVVPRGQAGGGQVTPPTSSANSSSVNRGPNTTSAGISCNPDGTGLPDQNFNPASGGVYTAIGCIPTNPAKLVNGLLRLATAGGGGIAFLLMIVGAFQMITSSGNPETLKKGQEQITSAVIGLLFIIFSVLLLQLIGVKILNIF